MLLLLRAVEFMSSCQSRSISFASALVAASASVAVVVQVKAMRLVQQPSTQGQRAWQEEGLTHTRAHIFGLASGFLSLSSCCQCNFYARQCAAAASEAADKLCIQRGVRASVCQCVLWNFFIIISVLAATAAVAAAAEAATCHLMPTLHVPLLHVVFAFCGATIACHAHRVRQREREGEEKRAHRAWPLYSSIFVCRISWHFSVRRQLLPVSVSVTLAPLSPPVRTLLCRRALFVLARVQDVPTFCCP